MDEQQYRMTLTDVQWWCCDIPGNIGWIIWIVCNVKTLIEGVDLYAILMLLPTALMLIGVVELISERIAKLDRILPRLRLYRGFGSLTLGGILGVPVAIAGLVMKTGGSRSWWMLAGAVLCGLFAGLCFAGYKKIEK
ncbi:MAG: hypothetical protein IKH23_05910 [Clostridiales bacterium]|nr:hypothetical protein [Clostridiales bacterium]